MIVPWQKPFRGTPINPAHPLARGLIGAYLLNEAMGLPRDAITATPVESVYNTDWSVGPGGPCFAFTAASQNSVRIRQGSIVGHHPEWSVVVLFSTGNNDARGLYAERGNIGNDICKLAIRFPNRVRYTYRDDVGVLLNKDGLVHSNLSDGAMHCLAMTRQGSVIRGYYDGALDLDDTYAGSYNFTDAKVESWIGADKGDSIEAFDGKIYAVYLYDRAISALDASVIARHPYCMFRQDLDIGADEYVVEGGTLSIPVAMHHYNLLRSA